MPLQVPSKATVATLSTVAVDSTASVQLVGENKARMALLLYNDSTADAFVCFGAAASSTSFTIKMIGGSYYEMPQALFAGIINCRWSAADPSGAMRVTELS